MAGILGDRYQLIGLIGAGETGEVWEAYDRVAGQAVAVKIVHPHLAEDPRLVDRLIRSRTVLLGLWHPGIARGLDVLVGDGRVAVITELVDGVDLRQHLGDAIGVTEAVEIGTAMADALTEAHRLGIVHGGLKPSNVVIPTEGDSAAKVTDFSLDLLIRAGRARGEESRYVAPEVIDGTVPARSSDIYSLGVLLYDLVSELDDAVPESLRQLIIECTDLDPASRPSAAETGERLRDMPRPAAAPKPVLPPPVRTVDEPRRQASKPSRRGLVLGSVLAAIALVAAGIAVTQLGNGTEPAAQQPPAPTTAAAVSRPALPAAAGAQTREGGQEFVRHWFALLSYAVQTGDVAALREVTRAECAQCATTLASLQQVRAAGGTMQGGTFTVRDVTTTTLWIPDRPMFDATLDRLPRSAVDGSGATTGTTPGLTFANCVLVLEWSASKWRVFEVTTPGCLG